MNRIRSGFSIVIAVTGAVGCAAITRVSLDDAPPITAPITAQSRPLVAVGSFVDGRGKATNWVGVIRGGYGNPLKSLESVEPVRDVVAKAFANGLRARGILADKGGAPYILSGVVRRLDANQYIRQEANAELQIVLTEASSGRELYSQTYRNANVEGSLIARWLLPTFDTGILGSVEKLRALTAKTLREAVGAALDDPAFHAVIR